MGDMKMDATMMAEMAAKKKANTERITSLMAQVKSASGDVEVAALADVVAVLLEEAHGHERALRVDDGDYEKMKACACTTRHQRKRIVLTGGPGAGKTAVLELVRQPLRGFLRRNAE